jgi:cytoskeletal protein CcmA (bactofilin family)
MTKAAELAKIVDASGNVVTSGTVEPAGDTAAGDNAAIGFTSAEGIIITGQGSTNDVTIKNDADADVIEIPTGTTNVTVAGTLTATGFIIGSADINENDLESIDGITAGTVAASKAAIVDTNKDITGFRNITLTGELDAATLDVSGDADIDGTLEADAITIGGTAIASVLSPVAGSSSIVTTGALNSGSITSGFGNINNGTSTLTTGNSDINGTLNVQGETTLQTHLNMGDNDIIKLGDSADLTIYHDGSNSYIDDSGTGKLFARSSQFQVQKYTGENMIVAVADGRVDLYYDNAKKLETTSTGVTVTGTLVGTALDISGDIDVDGTTNLDVVDIDGAVDMASTLTVGGAFTSQGIDDNADAVALTIDGDENVAIGVTSKNSANNGSLTIGHTGMTKITGTANGNADELILIGANASANVGMSMISNNANQGIIYFGDEDDTDIGGIIYDHPTNDLVFQTNTSEKVRVKSGGDLSINDGNLVIGTSGHGIDFSATSDGSGSSITELLSDYEQGSWTPTVIASSGGTASLGTSQGAYTKIGRLVNVTGVCVLNGAGSTASSGTVQISSLPFTVSNNLSGTGVEASGNIGYYDNFATAVNSLNIIALDSDVLRIYANTDNTQTSATNLTFAMSSYSGGFRFTISYYSN